MVQGRKQRKAFMLLSIICCVVASIAGITAITGQAANAISLPSSVDVTGIRSIKYGSDINIYREMNTIDGQSLSDPPAVHCSIPGKEGIQPGVTKPCNTAPLDTPWGDSQRSSAQINDIRACVWFGKGGPGYDVNSSMWRTAIDNMPSVLSKQYTSDEDRAQMITHMILSDVAWYNGKNALDLFDGVSGASDIKEWAQKYVIGFNVNNGQEVNSNSLRHQMCRSIGSVPGEDEFLVFFVNYDKNKTHPEYSESDGGQKYQAYLTFLYYPRKTGKGYVQKVSANPSITANNPYYSFIGAEFGWYPTYDDAVNGTNLVGTLKVTDESGNSQVSQEHDVGDYWMKELVAPPGYKLNSTPVKLTIVKDEVTHVTIADEPCIGEIKVAKRDSETGKLITDPRYAFTFELTNTTTHTSYGSKTTSNGYATWSNLPLGQYTISETSAPTPYLLAADQTVELTESNCSVTREVTFTDSTPDVYINIKKIDDKLGKPVIGAQFNVTTVNSISTPLGGQKYAAGDSVGTITTKSDGTGSLGPIPLDISGTDQFVITETYCPVPFAITSEPKTVTATQTNHTQQAIYVTADITNTPVPVNMSLEKVDGETNKPIKGAKFDIVATSDVTFPGGYVIYAANTVLEKDLVSDENGIVRNTRKDLWLDADGTSHYAFVEKSVPVPYYIVTSTTPVSAKYVDSSTTQVTAPQVTVENMPEKGTITVKKTDNVKHTMIEGAKYEIYCTKDIYVNGELKVPASDTKAIETITTKTDGTATSSELYIGDDGWGYYKVKEIYVPESLTIDKSNCEWEANIPYANATTPVTTRKVDVEDELAYGEVEVTKTENVKGGPVEGAVFNIVPTEDIKLPNGTVVYEKDSIVETITTKSDGKAKSTKPLYVDSDKTSNYKLVETFVPTPYYVTNKETAFTVKYKDMYTVDVGITHVAIQNEPAYGRIKLEKVDNLTHTPIKDAEFEVRASEDVVLPNGNTLYDKDQLIEIVTTDEDGIAETTEKLYIGKEGRTSYYFYEVGTGGAPFAYPSGDEEGGFHRKYEATLEYKDCWTTNLTTATIEITNRVVESTLQVMKLDSETSDPLADCTFEIRAAEEIALPNGTVIYEENQLVDTITTDKTGSASTHGNVLYVDADDTDDDDNADGVYLLIETDAPDGHVIATQPTKFSVVYDGPETPVIKMPMMYPVNKPNELDLDKTVLASDGQTFEDTVVEGATFRLWKQEDELGVVPEDGKNGYALRVDDGSEEHDVLLTSVTGYAQVSVSNPSGYTVSLRDGRGNMHTLGEEPIKVDITTQERLSCDVIVESSDGSSVNGVIGDTHLRLADGDDVVLTLTGGHSVAPSTKSDDSDAENENAESAGNAASNDNEAENLARNGATDTAANANENGDDENENGNEPADAADNENSADNGNTNASDLSFKGLTITAETGHVAETSIEPEVRDGAYIFATLVPGTKYNVMVDGDVVYTFVSGTETAIEPRLVDGDGKALENGQGINAATDSSDDAGDETTGSEDGSAADADADTDTDTDGDADESDGSEGDSEPASDSDAATDAKSGTVAYGRYSTTAERYAYKRQPMLLKSDDLFIDAFEINGVSYEVPTKTDAEGKIVIKRIKPGNYGFAETDVPFVGSSDNESKGTDRSYLINTAIYYFNVDEKTGRLNDSELVSTNFDDDYTKATISKNEITGGNEIPGAHLEIRDEDGNLVEEWTSTDTPHYIDRLTPGKYTLTETIEPAKYDQAATVEFTISDTGEVQTVNMHDAPSEINAKIDKRQEIADPFDTGVENETTSANGDGANKADVTESDEGRFSYSLDYVNDSNTYVDEFTVYDPLDGVNAGYARVTGITTAQAYQDYDGLMNVWYQTNKTPSDYTGDKDLANATMDDGHDNPRLTTARTEDGLANDPDGDGRVLDYTGWRLWEKGVPTDIATRLDVSELGLAADEYVTGIRFEYGRVESGFTTRLSDWDRAELKDEHDDMKPIEREHTSTFESSARNAVLARLATIRTFMGALAGDIDALSEAPDASDADSDAETDANANANVDADTDDNAGNGNGASNNNNNGSANDASSDAENANESTPGGSGDSDNASEADETEPGTSDDAESTSETLYKKVTAILDKCEDRVKEGLDVRVDGDEAASDKAISQALHDARDEIIDAFKAALDESSASDADINDIVSAIEKQYGAMSDSLDDETNATVQGEIDRAKSAAASGTAATAHDASTNAIASIFDGIAAFIVGGDAENATATGDTAIHYAAAVLDMQLTPEYKDVDDIMENSARVDAYRNGGGDGLEGHDEDKVRQVPILTRYDLAEIEILQTGDGLGNAIIAITGTASAIAAAAYAMKTRR